MTPSRRQVLGGAFILTLFAYVLYAYWQPVYTYAKLDPRFDAHEYGRAYAYFKGQAAQYLLSFPFNARILGPWLAAQFSAASISGIFQNLNGFFLLLTVGFLVLIWQQFNIRKSLIFIGLCWILLHWKGPVRMYLPDPISADVPLYFFEVAWLYLALKISQNAFNFTAIQAVFFGLIAILGTLQKEVFLVVIAATWAFFLFQKQRIHWLFLGCLGLGAAAHGLADWHFAPLQADWRDFGLITVLRGLKRYALAPQLWIRLPVSWLLAYGFLWLGRGVVVVPSAQRFGFRYLQLMSLIWLVLSIVGGGDTTRIFVNGLPFVLTFLLIRLHAQPHWVGYGAAMASLPLMRLHLLEPDLGLFPQKNLEWCVECWTLAQSWPYWVYAALILGVYQYFARRLEAVDARKSHKI